MERIFILLIVYLISVVLFDDNILKFKLRFIEILRGNKDNKTGGPVKYFYRTPYTKGSSHSCCACPLPQYNTVINTLVSKDVNNKCKTTSMQHTIMQLKKQPAEAVRNQNAASKKGLTFLITRRNNWITNGIQITDSDSGRNSCI